MIGSLSLSAFVTLASGLASGMVWLGPPAGDDGVITVEDPGESERPPQGAIDSEPEPAAPDALVHLGRAQALMAAGDLASAEAEVSVAISLQPDDAAAYLERAQIRVALAEREGRDDAAHRRAHAELLRLAAQDVLAYLEHAEIDRESVVWFEARGDALLREADALDPPAPPADAKAPAADPPLPVLPPPPRRDIEVQRRRSTTALLSTGAVASAAAVGLAAASVRIEQVCQSSNGPCAASWKPQPLLLASTVVLASLGSTLAVSALARAPSLERRRVRVAVGSSSIALGSAAAVIGAITGALAGARWNTPASPSDGTTLGTTQSLANTSVASFTAALPLLGAGLTAWVRHGLASRQHARTTMRGRAPRPRPVALDRGRAVGVDGTLLQRQ